jgi:nucleotide-binding universal stress UspA family protein
MTLATHILTATDFSAAADKGLEKAAAIAEMTGAKLTLVHVFDPTPLAPMATRGMELAEQLGSEQDVEQAILRALEDTRANVLGTVKNVALETIHGSNAATTLTTWAEEHGVDLIVVATHGRTGLAHFLIGSVAENVVRHAKCPVLTVPVAK